MTDSWRQGDRVWLRMKYVSVCRDSRQPYFTFSVTLPIRDRHPLHLWDHSHTLSHISTPTHLSNMRCTDTARSVGTEPCLFMCSGMMLSTLSEKLYSNIKRWHWLLANLRYRQSAELHPNQRGDSYSFGLCEIGSASRRRHVTDHLK